MKKAEPAVLWGLVVCVLSLAADWTGLIQRLPIEKSAVFGLVVALFAAGVIRDAASNRFHKRWIRGSIRLGGFAATFIASTLYLNEFFERQMLGIKPDPPEWMALDYRTSEPTQVSVMGQSLPTYQGRLAGSLAMARDPDSGEMLVSVSSKENRRVLARIESESIAALGLFNWTQIRGIDERGEKTPSGDLQEVGIGNDLSLAAGCRAQLPPPYQAYALETITYGGDLNNVRIVRLESDLPTGCAGDLDGTFPIQPHCNEADADAKSCYVCERNIRNKEFAICENTHDEGVFLIGVLAHNHVASEPWARFAVARLAIEARLVQDAEPKQELTAVSK